MEHETITAISTSPGESGIGIIRISGSESLNIANKIFTNIYGQHKLLSYDSHTIHYGFITDEEKVIDEVMITIMKAPNSYTKEDVIEINCHGGIRVCKNILDTVIKYGARIAEPGEFTKRAFLNGRLDLTRAEAVMDTIRAQSDIALNNSLDQLKGSLYNLLDNICSEIKYEIAFIESALDDPDSISLDGYSEILSDKIKTISDKFDTLIKSYDEGRIISEGISTVILGKPNAGKSSLLNTLLNEERAIVTNIPGTTRDTLTEKIKLGDIILNITDTAGIRETDDPIENIGVNKAKESVNKAELIIYVCDSTSNLDKDDEEILSIIKNKEIIVLLNKDDLSGNVSHTELSDYLSSKNITAKKIISTSMTNLTGIEELKDTIRNMFYEGTFETDNHCMITNLRHVHLLKRAKDSLEKVQASINDGMSEDFYSIDLTDAYSSLAEITGAEVNEDIVNEIFSKFCMGK